MRASVLGGSEEAGLLQDTGSEGRQPGTIAPGRNLPASNVPKKRMLEQALALDPSNPVAHRKLGVLLLQSHDLPGAEREFRAAVRLRPNDARSHLGLAISLRAMGRREEARQEFKEYQRLAPNTPAERQFLERVGRNFHGVERARPGQRPIPRFTDQQRRKFREMDR